MERLQHIAIYTIGLVDIHWLINEIQQGGLFDFPKKTQAAEGQIFNSDTLHYFIDEEWKHGRYLVSTNQNNPLSTSSNGEQRMAILQHLIAQKPAYLIIDNVFDSLDANAQQHITTALASIAPHTLMIQVMGRKSDCLPFIKQVFTIKEKIIIAKQSAEVFNKNSIGKPASSFEINIPAALKKYDAIKNPLIKMQDVLVEFNEKIVLQNINWQINTGEFWQLVGPNGSGKTTLLSIITGDSSKGYGQNIILFGNKKGSGETVWSIKEKIGYFASYMLLHFDRLHSASQIIIGGLFDSIGLYSIASNLEEELANQWLKLLGLYDKRDTPFIKLQPTQQRLVFLARAMVKHPPLLILDEPTTGLDDAGAALFIELVNKIAAETNTAILYVSHRKEEGLLPQFTFTLTPGDNGSLGSVAHTNVR